jgi:hypothetical protein
MFLDARTFQLMRTYDWEIGSLNNVAFSANGTLAAAGSTKGKAVVWDVDV